MDRGLPQLNHEYQAAFNYTVVYCFNIIKLTGMIRRRTPLLQPRKKPQRVSSDRLYIREHRQRRDVKLTELAKAIGKSKGLMSQIENGSCDPSVETLGQIAGFFGLAHRGMLFEPPAIAARPSSSPKTITAKAFPAIHDLHSFT